MDSPYPTKSVTIPAEIFTNSNLNVLLCRRAKQAKNIKFYLFTNCQILMYYCEGQQSKLKPGLNLKLNIQTVQVLMSPISIYNCVGKLSKLKNFK